MKKLSILLMSAAIALVAAISVSCKTETTPSGDPEFSVYLSNGPEFTYSNESNEPVKLKLESDSFDFYKDKLKVIALDNDTTEEEDVDCSLSVNYTRTRWDIAVSGADTTAGKTCDYTLYVHYNQKAKLADCEKISFKITVGGTYVPVPVITVQPVGANYKQGETAAALSVTATIESGSISYQWYKNGVKIDGATSSTYTPTETGTYYVAVSNASNSLKSEKSADAKIVFENPNAKTPVISSDIEDQTVDEISKAASLTVKASVDSGVIHAQWYKDGAKVGSEVTGEKEITASITPDSFGEYYVELWNVNGDEQSGKITSKIAAVKESAITIIITGISNEAVVGSTLTVSASSEVPCDFSYQWYETDDQSSVDTKISGETSSSYKASKEGTYFCRVTATSKATGIKSLPKDSESCYVKTTLSEPGSGNISVDFN